MDWSNERYVRLYTRDTIGWKMMAWQARALWPLLLRKVDRAGVLDLEGHGVEGLAAIVELPVEVVREGLEGEKGLLADGCVREVEGRLLVPNFIEAQEAAQSDAQRQREARERRRALAAAGELLSRNVTNPQGGGHGRSRAVTPSLAVPSRSEPGSPPTPSSPKRPPSSPAGGAKSAAGRRGVPQGISADAAVAAVSAVCAAIEAGVGASYPPQAFEALRRALRRGAISPDEAELLARWACADSYWGEQVGADPRVIFSQKNRGALLARAKASPAARRARSAAARAEEERQAREARRRWKVRIWSWVRSRSFEDRVLLYQAARAARDAEGLPSTSRELLRQLEHVVALVWERATEAKEDVR